MARICCTLPGPDAASNIVLMREYAPVVSAFEIRLDLLSDSDGLKKIFEELEGNLQLYSSVLQSRENEFSLILTLRRPEDGGKFSGSSADSIRKLTESVELALNYPQFSGLLAVDLETQTPAAEFAGFMVEKSSTGKVAFIRSYHNFESTPQNLEELLDTLAAENTVPKLAVTPRGLEDLTRIAEAGKNWQRNHSAPAIILGMGEYGVPSRIIPEKFGSCISFASPGRAVAPGQMDAADLYKKFRIREPNSSSALFAIIGNPVSHSKSPEYHNSSFERKNISALYLPLLVDDAAVIPRFAQAVDLCGASVTVPHKEAVREFLDSEDSGCRFTGACNTIVRSLDTGSNSPAWRGINSDIPGFLGPIEEFLEGREQNLKVTVIGAGGAGRAVAYALASRGCSILLLNRSVDRAERLAEEMNSIFPEAVHAAGLDENSSSAIQNHRALIVQTTSLGMKGSEGQDPLQFYEFSGDEFAYDIIYTPPLTRFLERAKQAGCTVINGEEMFSRQAEIQAEVFSKTALEWNRSNGIK